MEIFSNSVIVAAHPDDEILWFSSVLSKVDKIVLCFLSIPSRPDWTEGRRKSIASYPLDNVHCLKLEEAEVFGHIDWNQPVLTTFGLNIIDSKLSKKVYKQNFDILKTKLRDHLQDCDNVFTHNPWGEYGHADHVQVYRAVKALQEELGFNLWFSNYVSNKSAYLMSTTLPDFTSQVTMATDKRLAESIAEIYKNNNCWTWFDNYKWCDSEVFIKDSAILSTSGGSGAVLPINLIELRVQPKIPTGLEKFSLKFKKKWMNLLSIFPRSS